MISTMAAEYNSASSEKKRLFTVVLIGIFTAVLLLIVICTSGNVYASSFEDMANNVSSKFDELYNAIGTILTALAAVAIGICAFKWIFGTDPQTVRQAKTWLFYICIGVAVYWGAKAIINLVQSVTESAVDSSGGNTAA